jgi:transketolase
MTTAPALAPDEVLRAKDPDLLAIDTIRTLAIDAVEKAQSGHAGAPMGMAPVAYTLWSRWLRYDPAAPAWPNRDRFVLSAGHASMLLYALLHLSGVQAADRHGQPLGRPAVSLDDIKNFRELGSVCPGHPEYGVTTGVEVTTGPLGQGVANSVGMSIAGRWLAARYNQPGVTVFDHDVYALCSDGDMMEGVSGEAASLAGHLKLSNLCWIYDDNTVTIEGHTDLAFSEDVLKRFTAYGWSVLSVEDANDLDAVSRAIETFRKTDDRPTFIRVRSIIGYGAPDIQGTSKAHSDPLGPDEVRKAKAAYGWPQDAQFLVPDGVRERFDASLGARGRQTREAWEQSMRRLAEANPERAEELRRLLAGETPAGWSDVIAPFPADAKGMATREASGKALNILAERSPWLLGGAADLSPSTKTKLEFDGAGSIEPGQPGGRNMHFGIREHAMGSIVNGMTLSGLRAYTATFLVFSDYMRPPTRLASLMEIPSIFVFSHDSIGLGQDGPTHQPIEQLAALRAIPGLITLRPADANETAEAWRVIMGLSQNPAALILSRQPVPTLDRTRYAAASGVARGGYVLADSQGAPDVILMGTGTEVSLCVAAFERLAGEGIAARVVSLPSWELFEQQDEAYRLSVLPKAVTARVSVEAGAPQGWDRYVGMEGEMIAMRTFGASAPIKPLMAKFGFTVDAVCEAARRQLARAAG